jgi:hypothetical protein
MYFIEPHAFVQPLFKLGEHRHPVCNFGYTTKIKPNDKAVSFTIRVC